MTGSIRNETSLLDAFGEPQDVASLLGQQFEFQKLSPIRKITRIVCDFAVKFFAYVLGVKISGRNVEALSRRYNEYAHGEEQSVSQSHRQKVILVLGIENSIPTEPKYFKELEKQAGCKIVFKKAVSAKAAISGMAELKKNGCTIEALWIRAHGTPTTITFQGEFSEDVLNIKPEHSCLVDVELPKVTSFCEAINQNVELEAPIILESCNTGKPMPAGGENIAAFISRTAQRKVFAPKKEALNIDDGVSYSEEKGFNVEMKSFRPDRRFASGSFLARLSAIWLAYRGCKEDITQVIVCE